MVHTNICDCSLVLRAIATASAVNQHSMYHIQVRKYSYLSPSFGTMDSRTASSLIRQVGEFPLASARSYEPEKPGSMKQAQGRLTLSLFLFRHRLLCYVIPSNGILEKQGLNKCSCKSNYFPIITKGMPTPAMLSLKITPFSDAYAPAFPYPRNQSLLLQKQVNVIDPQRRKLLIRPLHKKQ